ncbi:hypothetical protein C8R43DRAFT_1134100 [Mycena crocata]|nr:hypothetical protein C8R43DRAFT_1134100 [Mycena crocata]
MSTSSSSPSLEEVIRLTSQSETDADLAADLAADSSRPILAELPVYDLDSRFLDQFEPRYRIQLQHMLHTASRPTLLRARNAEYLQLYDAFIGESQARREVVGQELHRELLLAHRTLMDDYSRSFCFSPISVPNNSAMAMSDFEEDLEGMPELAIPGPAASRADYQEALKKNQQLLTAALRQNKEQEAMIDKFEAQAPGRSKRTAGSRTIRGVNQKGYQEHIRRWGKAHCVMEHPFTQTVHFGPKVSFPLALPDMVFQYPPSSLFNEHLRATIYRDIPERYHDLIDPAECQEFAGNFCRQVSNQRSVSINTLHRYLPTLLSLSRYNSDVIGSLLVYPSENPETTKISLLPPILFSHLKKDSTMFRNKLLPMALRLMLFGPSSIEDDGKRKPQAGTLGFMWNVQRITYGSMAFTCTAPVFKVVFLLYWMHIGGQREDFEEVGAKSQINFRAMYMRFRRALETKAKSVGIEKAVKLWHEIVFHGVTVVTPSSAEPNDAEVDEAAEMEAALADLDLEGDSGDNFEYDWHNETPVHLPSSPPRSRPQAQPQARPQTQPQARPQARPLNPIGAQVTSRPGRCVTHVPTGAPVAPHTDDLHRRAPSGMPVATRPHNPIAASSPLPTPSTPHLDLSRLVPNAVSTPIRQRAPPPPVDLDAEELPIRAPQGKRVHWRVADDDDDDRGELSSVLSSPPRSPTGENLEYMGPTEIGDFNDKSELGYDDDEDNEEDNTMANTSEWNGVDDEVPLAPVAAASNSKKAVPVKKAPAGKKVMGKKVVAKKVVAKKVDQQQAAAKKAQERPSVSKKKKKADAPTHLPVDPETLPYSTRNRAKRLQ